MTIRATSITVYECGGCDGIHVVLHDDDGDEIAEGIISLESALSLFDGIRRIAAAIAARKTGVPLTLEHRDAEGEA